jgi:acyl carrier protein
MNDHEIAELVRRTLARVAPEVEGEEIEPNVNFRDQFDIDSMDFLNFVIALHEQIGLDIPEADYPRLASLSGCVAYLSARLGAPRSAAEGR